MNDDWLKEDNGVETPHDMHDLQLESNHQDLAAEHQDLAAEMEVAEGLDHHHSSAGRSRRYMYIGAGVVVLLCVIVGVSVGVSGGKKKKTAVPAPSPTFMAPTTMGPTPTLAPEVDKIIMNNAVFGGSEFDDADSYQNKARNFVLTQDVPAPGVQGTMEEQALQLYALSCIFWSTYSVPNAWTNFHFGEDVALPGWFATDGWMEDSREVCSWHGIRCNDQDQVERLELDTNGLSGMFPPEVIFLADSLRYLDLYNNLVHNRGDEGNAFLGQLTNLEFLYYGTTSFEYDGIPTEIGLLTNLKEYDFSYTLYFGDITPGMWSPLTELNYLVMDGNAYNSTFPDDLIALPNLEYVYAGFSFLEGDLEFVTQMPKIYELWIDDNPEFTGTIPSNINEALALVSFSVSGCDLFGTIPTEMGLMTDMVQMWMFDNRLSGPIPTEFGDMKKLQELQLEVNELTGTMPSEICSRLTPFGRLQELEADCDGAISCPETCCTCCGKQCMESR